MRLARRRQFQFHPGNLACRLLEAEGQQGRGKRFLVNREREIHASGVDVTQGDLSNGLHKFHLSIVVCGHALLIAMRRPEGGFPALGERGFARQTIQRRSCNPLLFKYNKPADKTWFWPVARIARDQEYRAPCSPVPVF